jgi:hypothetical protein
MLNVDHMAPREENMPMRCWVGSVHDVEGSATGRVVCISHHDIELALNASRGARRLPRPGGGYH